MLIKPLQFGLVKPLQFGLNSFGLTLKNITAPIIAAATEPVVGLVLSVVYTGAYNFIPSSFEYRWQRAGVDIPLATNSSYTPVAADVGNVSCVVKAIKGSQFVETSSNTLVVVASPDMTVRSGAGIWIDFDSGLTGNEVDKIASRVVAAAGTGTILAGSIGGRAYRTLDAANSQRFEIVNDSALRALLGAGDMHTAIWFRRTTTAATPFGLWRAGDAGGANAQAAAYYRANTGNLGGFVSIDGTTLNTLTEIAGAVPVTDWCLVEMYFDASAQEWGMSVDGGLWYYEAQASIFDGSVTTDFTIGRYVNYYFTGDIAMFAGWPRRITPDERQSIFNAGVPPLYA